jgi:hypothetical protein
MKITYTPAHSASAALLALSASALLVACGSGNNSAAADSPPTVGVALVPGTDVPIDATQDASAATEFIRSVVAKGEANTDSPLVLGDAVLATSELAEPAGV